MSVIQQQLFGKKAASRQTDRHIVDVTDRVAKCGSSVVDCRHGANYIEDGVHTVDNSPAVQVLVSSTVVGLSVLLNDSSIGVGLMYGKTQRYYWLFPIDELPTVLEY
ncbi:hypothetical protein J6590_009916 [Homalodisca vitripennis]|nr:hypothetical protein J6590_009916 [Homalodisca vitripennis]